MRLLAERLRVFDELLERRQAFFGEHGRGLNLDIAKDTLRTELERRN